MDAPKTNANWTSTATWGEPAPLAPVALVVALVLVTLLESIPPLASTIAGSSAAAVADAPLAVKVSGDTVIIDWAAPAVRSPWEAPGGMHCTSSTTSSMSEEVIWPAVAHSGSSSARGSDVNDGMDFGAGTADGIIHGTAMMGCSMSDDVPKASPMQQPTSYAAAFPLG